jgi:hypothetical protein
VSFDGRSQIDAFNLGYDVDDVARCLYSLRPEDFVKTLTYPSPNGKRRIACDVYRTKCQNSDEVEDDLYVKVRVSGWVVVVSFHRPR